MKHPLAAGCLLLASLSASAEKPAQPAVGVHGVDEASAQIMLDVHNEWRRKAEVSELIWSDKLTESAQAWADHLVATTCQMKHSTDRDYGENIAWSSGRRLSPDRVVSLWGSEKKHYNLKENSCVERQICGHYTQMVWADTREVGCGHALCGGAEIWVCHYFPKGNLRGETPY